MYTTPDRRYLAYATQLSEHDIPMGTQGRKGLLTHKQKSHSKVINKQDLVYDDGSDFKLHFKTLFDSYGLKRKPTSVKNPQANAILERVHQMIMGMLRTVEIDMADTVSESDRLIFSQMLHGPLALPTTQY